MAKIRVCDINDFFTMTGGGVRRYHLEKLRYMARQEDVEYHLLVPSAHSGVEIHGNARIHHVPALPLGRSGYRLVVNPLSFRKIIAQIRPDVIEVGSPYTTPDWVKVATLGVRSISGKTPRFVGFWHANFPVTDVGRAFGGPKTWLGRLAETAAWAWARRTFGQFDVTMAATQVMVNQLTSHGISRVAHTPLGVDTQMFHPKRRDAELRATWGAGPDDVVLCYPNRLSEEKNYRPLLQAYELLRQAGHQPILVVAGHGPGVPEVKALAAKYPQVHYMGYIERPIDMARMLASVDVVATLCPYETFGLSAVEAMASGAALLGSGQMSIGELLEHCNCGISLPETTPEAVAEAWLELSKPGRAELLGKRGLQECQSRYSWKSTFTRVVGVYEDVIARRLTADVTRLLEVEPPVAAQSKTQAEKPAIQPATVRITGRIPRFAENLQADEYIDTDPENIHTSGLLNDRRRVRRAAGESHFGDAPF